ncbi:B12-binding domain-containing radical SAM protein [Rhizobium sp. C1]|uniref:B12-binding domain-containing radical SAM protein n=1 Tax=Rhizobium sp. C1 TaxID=1349799 RepID=UPI0022A94998|nr:radical SAM protein [Rhizobium sp. C1]
MRRVLFVIPPYFDVHGVAAQGRAAVLPSFTIPYGILSMEAYLRVNCSKLEAVRLIDLNVTLKKLVEDGRTDEYEAVFRREIEASLIEFRPQIFGVSALFNTSFGYVESVLDVVKSHDPSILTICGGGLPSAAFEMMLRTCPSLDAICKGEGELPMKALIDSEDPWDVITEHKAWVDRAQLATGKVPQHDFIQELDEIPEFDYSFIDLDNYNSRSIDKRYADRPKREMAIHTSRGCPFLCVFCSNPSLHGRSMRAMSVERVVNDVTRMRDEFDMTVLLIEDDHFFFDKERAKTLLKAFADLGIRCEFPNGVAVYAIDDEVAFLFSAAGVSAVVLAVESGSDYVLNHIIKKPLKKKLIRPAVEALRRHDVRSHVFIVVGLPGEMDEHRKETMDMLLETGFDWIHINLAIPIFGSRLYDICVENGYLETTRAEDFVATRANIRAPGVDPIAVENFAYEAQLRVNFAESANMRLGRHHIAMPYFQNVVSKYPEHAFGQFFYAKCLELEGRFQEARLHRAHAERIFADDPWWRDLAERFGVIERSEPADHLLPSALGAELQAISA